jgi:hypothetical protein
MHVYALTLSTWQLRSNSPTKCALTSQHGFTNLVEVSVLQRFVQSVDHPPQTAPWSALPLSRSTDDLSWIRMNAKPTVVVTREGASLNRRCCREHISALNATFSLQCKRTFILASCAAVQNQLRPSFTVSDLERLTLSFADHRESRQPIAGSTSPQVYLRSPLRHEPH